MSTEIEATGAAADGRCPLCGKSHGYEIERRQAVPIFQNYTYATRDEAVSCRVGDLDIVGCAHCGFVWNRAFDPTIAVYDSGYENDQTFSGFFKDHVGQMVERVIRSFPPTEPISILEIGCGQGQFVTEIEARAGDQLRHAYGFDPAYRGPLTKGNRLRFQADYATSETVKKLGDKPRIIVSRHTIEHVSDPLGFLRAIRSIFSAEDDVRLFIETPCVHWILDGCVIQDLFYEHCSLFSKQTLEFALKASGFKPIQIDHVFGGQYLWAEAQFDAIELNKPAPSHSLEQSSQAWSVGKKTWEDLVLSSDRRIAIWGAGAKGMTFAQITDPAARYIDCIIDINPAKQGRFSPGSGHAIVSPPEALARGVELVLVMNPIYIDEIRDQTRAIGASFTLQSVE